LRAGAVLREKLGNSAKIEWSVWGWKFSGKTGVILLAAGEMLARGSAFDQAGRRFL